MTMVQASILPGFMELLPEEQKQFDKMRRIIEKNFIKYGFLNLDTPLIEKQEILLSKGGGETSKQIYRIDKETTKQALRFDLTVSLARYVAMHQNDLNFPFRRYQIDKVYRGERNQRGRYREFYQCDVDIVGKDKLDIANDAEIPALIYDIFKDLGFSDITIRLNNRKLLQGFLEHINIDDFEEVLRTIDKLDKIGQEKTKTLLVDQGLDDGQIKDLFDFILVGKPEKNPLEILEDYDIDNEKFLQGKEELKEVYDYMLKFEIPSENIKIDFSVTRGLDYYTGTVYETFLNGYEDIGSVCSGGRYDDLANNFTRQKFPGIGMSIGLTRLYYQLNEAGLIKFENPIKNPILVIPMSEETMDYSIDVVNDLRNNDIKSQIYLEDGKVKKKFSYADNLGVDIAIIIGSEEIKDKKVSVRNFVSGQQELVDRDKLIDFLGEIDEG